MSSEQLAEVVALLEACGLPFEDLTAAHLADFVILHDEAAVIACVGVEIFGASGLLRSLAVAEGWRGRGLGRKLTHAIEQHAVQHNVQRLYLLTETAADFFARFGYSRIERDAVAGGVRNSAEFRILCPASAVCMMKLLA